MSTEDDVFISLFISPPSVTCFTVGMKSLSCLILVLHKILLKSGRLTKCFMYMWSIICKL